MTLRIVGGNFRNRALISPKGEQTRPTLAVLRKAVYDILQDRVEEAHVLDLFAGSGAMGIEAISRGAAHATFVENNPLALRCLRDNIEKLGIQSQTTILSCDAMLAIKKLIKSGGQFNIVYVDPPYAAAIKQRLLAQLLHLFDTNPLLQAEGTLFLEEAAPATLLPQTTSLRHVDSRKFSRSILHQFQQSATLNS